MCFDLRNDPNFQSTVVGFLSPDGRCYSFDHRANGYGRGEGVSCVVLKLVDDALDAGNHVRAVLRNTGINQDGKTPGITFPNAKAQESLARKVYAQAGLDPLDTTFIETQLVFPLILSLFRAHIPDILGSFCSSVMNSSSGAMEETVC